MADIPNTPPGAQDPKSNARVGDITPSNKSPQTSQAGAQNVPAGRANGGAKAVISGAGSSGRQIVNGKNGRASFRK